jgi:hypothetical protein
VRAGAQPPTKAQPHLDGRLQLAQAGGQRGQVQRLRRRRRQRVAPLRQRDAARLQHLDLAVGERHEV